MASSPSPPPPHSNSPGKVTSVSQRRPGWLRWIGQAAYVAQGVRGGDQTSSPHPPPNHRPHPALPKATALRSATAPLPISALRSATAPLPIVLLLPCLAQCYYCLTRNVRAHPKPAATASPAGWVGGPGSHPTPHLSACTLSSTLCYHTTSSPPPSTPRPLAPQPTHVEAVGGRRLVWGQPPPWMRLTVGG